MICFNFKGIDGVYIERDDFIVWGGIGFQQSAAPFAMMLHINKIRFGA